MIRRRISRKIEKEKKINVFQGQLKREREREKKFWKLKRKKKKKGVEWRAHLENRFKNCVLHDGGFRGGGNPDSRSGILQLRSLRCRGSATSNTTALQHPWSLKPSPVFITASPYRSTVYLGAILINWRLLRGLPGCTRRSPTIRRTILWMRKGILFSSCTPRPPVTCVNRLKIDVDYLSLVKKDTFRIQSSVYSNNTIYLLFLLSGHTYADGVYFTLSIFWSCIRWWCIFHFCLSAFSYFLCLSRADI